LLPQQGPATMAPFKTIAIVREIESPENPGGLEKRVSVIPGDIAKLTNAGHDAGDCHCLFRPDCRCADGPQKPDFRA